MKFSRYDRIHSHADFSMPACIHRPRLANFQLPTFSFVLHTSLSFCLHLLPYKMQLPTNLMLTSSKAYKTPADISTSPTNEKLTQKEPALLCLLSLACCYKPTCSLKLATHLAYVTVCPTVKSLLWNSLSVWRVDLRAYSLNTYYIKSLYATVYKPITSLSLWLMFQNWS